MLTDHWAERAGSVYGRGQPDQPDAAHGVQAGLTPDRWPDDVGADVGGLDDLSAGPQHGQPPGETLSVIQPATVPPGPLHVLIDSTGLQVYEAGQWLEAKQGAKSRRKWRKLHLAVDAASGMIVAQTLTDQDADDPSRVGPLLDQFDEPIGQVTADGAYDGSPTHQTTAAHSDGIEAVIPPRSTAAPSGDPGPPTQRDSHLAIIAEHGRLAWQATTGYSQRSLVATTMGRYESLIGLRLRARGFAAQ